MHILSKMSLLVVLAVGLVSCGKDEMVAVDRSSGFDVFVENYNGYIIDWLQRELKQVEAQEVSLQKELDDEAATENEKAITRKEMESLATTRTKLKFLGGNTPSTIR